MLVPDIVLPVLTSAPLKTTFPLMVDPVKVTAPAEPTSPVTVEVVAVTAAVASAAVDGGIAVPTLSTEYPDAVLSAGAVAAHAPTEAAESDAASAIRLAERYF
ncbi:MAG TPA: hypothetical protein VLS47_00210 [Gallionella sp.]|nr:hypothetical protein [Gallionella sp.]